MGTFAKQLQAICAQNVHRFLGTCNDLPHLFYMQNNEWDSM